MKLSIHPLVKGKPAKDDARLAQLGNGWENVEASWEDVYELITVDGYATSAELTSSHKAETNFKSRELLMVDIDSGMSIEELLANDFYNEYGAGFYATPSYTDEHPKFRIMFRAATPITNAEEYRRVMNSLLTIYAAADTACKDASRLFFGTVNCSIKEYKSNTLPDDVVQILIESGETQVEMQVAVLGSPKTTVLEQSQKDKIISLLCSIQVIPYDDWLRIGWGLKNAGFTFDEFATVTETTRGLTGKRSRSDAAKRWNDGSNYKNVTLGTVIYYIKNKLGNNCFTQERRYGKMY